MIPIKNYLRRLMLPYCLQLQPEGGYVILNRDYKPLGFWTELFVQYEKFPVVLPLKITPLQASRMSWEGKSDTNIIFLYSDSCHPLTSATNWTAFCKRLKVLASIKFKGELKVQEAV